MKRISCLVLTLLLALLCACSQTDTLPADDPPSADPVASLDDIPQVCRLYYTYAGWSPIAPADSKLPLAASASRGAPDYIPVWHEGVYSQLAANGGEGLYMTDLTGGKAIKTSDYGRFCWNDELYHCVHVQAEDSFIPGFCSIEGGVLWLDLSGDCWADNGTGGEIGLFGGFDTVVITGTGSLTLAQHIESGASQQAWPALVIDGVDVTVPSLFLNANSASDSTANLVVRSGSLTVEDMAFTTGDACVTGGTLTVSQLMDCTNLVCRGGTVTITEGWGFSDDGHQAVTPTVLLTGGTLDANVWMDERIEYQLWEGTITVPGIRYWPGMHQLSDNVAIIDPLDESQSG